MDQAICEKQGVQSGFRFNKIFSFFLTPTPVKNSATNRRTVTMAEQELYKLKYHHHQTHTVIDDICKMQSKTTRN